MTNAPKISVIIPMYNAEKFIAECLESLLAQTFQDFEVIIVDDCSTDSSPAIVESYAPKFNGRLTFSRLQKNSGSGATGRNKGLLLSRGEYVFFADADDLLTLTALEELYTLAKKFDAEVVYCERAYWASESLDEITLTSEQQSGFVDKPTFEPESLATRVDEILSRKFLLTPWGKLVSRDLLIDSEILFPPVKIGEDDIWLYGLLFYAKKFLRVPNVIYIWRQTENSMLRRRKLPQETITFWVNPIVYGLKTLDDMLSKSEFFRQNSQYRCAVIEQLVHSKTARLFEASLELSTTEIYSAIKDEFGKNLGEQDVLISWLLTDLITQQKAIFSYQQKIEELERKLEEKFL